MSKIYLQWGQWLGNENILKMRWMTGEWQRIVNEVNEWGMNTYREWGE